MCPRSSASFTTNSAICPLFWCFAGDTPYRLSLTLLLSFSLLPSSLDQPFPVPQVTLIQAHRDAQRTVITLGRDQDPSRLQAALDRFGPRRSFEHELCLGHRLVFLLPSESILSH